MSVEEMLARTLIVLSAAIAVLVLLVVVLVTERRRRTARTERASVSGANDNTPAPWTGRTGGGR